MDARAQIINYIERYAPSRERISLYLYKKGYIDAWEKLIEVGYDEQLMVNIWIRSFISLWRWEQDIRMKLLKKKFPKQMVEDALERFKDDIYNWENSKSTIEHRIHSYLSKGKSTRGIFSILIGRYPYFRKEIGAILENSSDRENLQIVIAKYATRYNISTWDWRQKVIASLMRKGFLYDDIRKLL